MKIISKKNILSAGILLVCLISLFSIIKVNEKKVITLGVFAGSPWDVPDPYTYEFLELAISKFENEHPGVKVEYISGIQKEDYTEWLSGKLVEGDAPDIFMVLPKDFSMLQKSGSLKSLDEIMERDSSFSSSDFYEGAYEFGHCDNAQYALPLECAPNMMFVNKLLLMKEGIQVPAEDWSWYDLYNICEKVTKDTDGNGVIDQFGIYNYSWKDAYITNNVNPFSQNGKKCYVQNKNSQEVVEFISKLEKLKAGAVVTSADFDEGKVAFMPLTLAEYRTYKPYPWSIKKYSDFDWECIPLPKGPRGENISVMNTLLMGMNSRTHNKLLSWELMKTFCYDEEIQLATYKYRSGGSPLKEILNQDDSVLLDYNVTSIDGNINVDMIKQIMANGVTDYNFKHVDMVESQLSQGIQDIIENDKSPRVALKNLQREINSSLGN